MFDLILMHPMMNYDDTKSISIFIDYGTGC